MKAISIRIPWAYLIPPGLKKIEVRSWKTDHRGPLAIHCSKMVDRVGVAYLGSLNLGFGDGVVCEPVGAIIATCNLVDIVEYETPQQFLADQHKHLSPGYARYGWVLEDAAPLVYPVHYPGKLGLFDIPDYIIRP